MNTLYKVVPNHNSYDINISYDDLIKTVNDNPIFAGKVLRDIAETLELINKNISDLSEALSELNEKRNTLQLASKGIVRTLNKELPLAVVDHSKDGIVVVSDMGISIEKNVISSQ